ncbi:His/Gly/Thr/Pro-type tRNA ligase C-terminal domain-containing protein [Akkermansia muciniphila]|nr:His/Gly/Thr/Pro-type tRNA ligase C-terminal domain-containing protein [Akkermansia muciniphila]
MPDGERAFYSKKTYDLEYEFPFGIQELEGIAYRTDYDLSCHQKGSGRPLEYFDEETREKFIPHVVEPSAGCDRTILAIICEAYDEEELVDDKGKKTSARYSASCPAWPRSRRPSSLCLRKTGNRCVLPGKLKRRFQPWMSVFYDETGAVGRRYRRQDEVGTPFCITVDFETLGENDASLKGTVTIRHRDSMKQERVAINDLLHWLIARVR